MQPPISCSLHSWYSIFFFSFQGFESMRWAVPITIATRKKRNALTFVLEKESDTVVLEGVGPEEWLLVGAVYAVCFLFWHTHLFPSPPSSPFLLTCFSCPLLFWSFFLLPPPPPSPSPPQINPNREGYYRTSYPQGTFGRLLEALKRGELEERDRIPIIEDTVALVSGLGGGGRGRRRSC